MVHKTGRLAWTVVDAAGKAGQVFGAVHGEVRALGHVLPEQTVGVLV